MARYVYTYEEFVIVTEAPQCSRMTVTGQDTDNKRTIYTYIDEVLVILLFVVLFLYMSIVLIHFFFSFSFIYFSPSR